MVLADDDRLILDVNGACLRLLGHARADIVSRPMYEFVAGRPVMTPQEWAMALARHRFSGDAEMVRADGTTVDVQGGATTELVTGRRLVLVVALSVSGRGLGIRGGDRPEAGSGVLSNRDREVVSGGQGARGRARTPSLDHARVVWTADAPLATLGRVSDIGSPNVRPRQRVSCAGVPHLGCCGYSRRSSRG
jgi:PAS domain-containing protein